MDYALTDNEKHILLKTAREAIKSRFTGTYNPDFPEPTPALREVGGAFVTLHKEGKLRGCIGNVIGIKSIIETVKDVAQSSAFQDPRFPPLRDEELSEVEIEISVLSPLRRTENIDEIQVGVHGIMIRRGWQSGLLLPQVATEYGWDRETFLTHTCLKAQLDGNCWRQSGTEIEIFSALVFSEKRMKSS